MKRAVIAGIAGLNDDTTAPTGGSITYAGGYTAGTTVSVAYTTGTDTGGCGVSTAAGQLQRRSTNLPSIAPGTCNAGGWTAWATIATNPANPYPDTVGTSTCYQYQYLPADNVGNVGAAYTSANTVKAPAPPPQPTAPATPATAPTTPGRPPGRRVRATTASPSTAPPAGSRRRPRACSPTRRCSARRSGSGPRRPRAAS